MTLAVMAAADESALICDFAETYHIYNYRALPVSLAAVLASGLGENSRIRKKISNSKADPSTALLAIIADRLGLIAWMLSDDGRKGINRPESIYGAITGEGESNENSDVLIFDSPEAFDEARRRTLERREVK